MNNIQPDIPHFVITRLGLGVYSKTWLERKFELMQVITIPSLMSQTSSDFQWMIVTDSNMPQFARNKLDEITGLYKNIHIVSIDPVEIRYMQIGGLEWVFDACRDYILGHGLIDNPLQYVITSMIDDDDAWHRQTVEMVNKFFNSKIDSLTIGETKNLHAVIHSAGIVMTYKYGIVWDLASGKCSHFNLPFHSMSVFAVHRFSSGISACTSRHLHWQEFSAVTGFEKIIMESEVPMWVYMSHPDSITGENELENTVDINDVLLQNFQNAYGIQADKAKTLRDYITSQQSSLERNTFSVERHYNDQFRITALNRQIDALEARLSLPLCSKRGQPVNRDDTVHLEMLLKTARSHREKMVESFRRNGEEFF